MIQCTTPRLAYPTAGRLRDRQEAQHEEDHPLHNQPVQEGQDMAVAGEAEQEAVPGRSTPHSVSSTDSPLSQILVALDYSSSMSDNRSRSIALQSLATISSALALLEVGQLGVLRLVVIVSDLI